MTQYTHTHVHVHKNWWVIYVLSMMVFMGSDKLELLEREEEFSLCREVACHAGKVVADIVELQLVEGECSTLVMAVHGHYPTSKVLLWKG